MVQSGLAETMARMIALALGMLALFLVPAEGAGRTYQIVRWIQDLGRGFAAAALTDLVMRAALPRREAFTVALLLGAPGGLGAAMATMTTLRIDQGRAGLAVGSGLALLAAAAVALVPRSLGAMSGRARSGERT